MDKREDSAFQTPGMKKSKKLEVDKSATPILIPPSPCMKKLGYGTGVNIYLIERFSPMGGCYKSPWAVKKINSRLRENDQEVKKRLEEETKILMSLSHPNIIGFRSQGRSLDGRPCLVMESVEGSLGDIIDRRSDQGLGPLPADSILKVAKSLASALDYLHRKCLMLHGDLKSPNVLIKGEFDAVKLCDFGVTIKLNDKMVVDDPGKYYIGTECWSAPEVLVGDELSNKTDMFSYGLVLWEMIALCPPHLECLNNDNLSLETSYNGDVGQEEEEKRQEEYEKALGTRPGLPNTSLNDSYNKVLEIFFVCTNADPAVRLSAGDILSNFFPDSDDGRKKNTSTDIGQEKTT